VTDDVVGVLVREKAIDAGTEAALRTVVERKNDVSRLASEIASRETEVQSIGRDQERVRENMRSLRGTSEERQLLQRYVRQLDEQEDRLGSLRREVAALTAERQQAQAELDRFIQGITAGAR
jgi:phage shock protein A